MKDAEVLRKAMKGLGEQSVDLIFNSSRIAALVQYCLTLLLTWLLCRLVHTLLYLVIRGINGSECR